MPRKILQMDLAENYAHPNVLGLLVPGRWLKDPTTLRVRKEGKPENMNTDSFVLIEASDTIKKLGKGMLKDHPVWVQ